MKGVELHQYVHIKECSNTEHSVMSRNVCFVLDFNIPGLAPANIACLYIQGIAWLYTCVYIAIQTSMFNACMTFYCNQLVRIVWYMHIWQYSYHTTCVTVQTDCKDERVMCTHIVQCSSRNSHNRYATQLQVFVTSQLFLSSLTWTLSHRLSAENVYLSLLSVKNVFN